MFSPQIHIIFNCEENERLIKPLIENPPNKLYYFTAYIKETKQRDVNINFFENNISLLKKEIPLLEIVQKEVDYTNYIEIIQELSKIIKFEREINENCNIFINVSSGSKMTAIASIEASKLWECEIYYVFSSLYDPHGVGARHKGEFFITRPTTFPTNKPKKIYIEILKLLENLIQTKYQRKTITKDHKKYVYKKDFIKALEKQSFLELERKHRDPNSRKSALYMKSYSLLKPLNNDLKYIKISDDKRNKKVYITDKGLQILDIFKYLI